MTDGPFIVLDMDGVITSEEGYWKAAACAVIDLSALLGHPMSQGMIMASDSGHLPFRLAVPHGTISAIKGLAINTNWDLCHLAACMLLRQLASASPEHARWLRACSWESDNPLLGSAWPGEVVVDFQALLNAFLALPLPGRGFELMEHLAQSMAAVGLPSEAFVRQGPLWQWCFRHFQVWFAGSGSQELDNKRERSRTPPRTGILREESLILPPARIDLTLRQLRARGWRLAIATGRTHEELIPTLQRHGLLQHFDPVRIVTHREIAAAEKALAADGREAQLSKPSPLPFLRALYPDAAVAELAFGTPPPLPPGTIFVGDTVGDMAPARQLGARGIAVLTGPGGAASEPALREAGATDVIADIAALPALLA